LTEKTSIADKIKNLRDMLKLTQEQLAVKARIPYTTLMKIESGQVKNPTVSTLKKIADALDVTIDYLISFNGK